jgi:hypothetical protein
LSSFVLSAGGLALMLASPQAGGQVSVWTYHNNNFRTGANTNETILNPTNVNSASFGRLFTNMVDGCVYAQPLYVPGVAIPGQGAHNLLFIATEHNTVYAFDADVPAAAGGLLWKTNLGPAAVTTIPGPASSGGYTNKNFGTRYNGSAYTDIMPQVGITGTPVIDTNSGTLYVDAFTGEVGATTNYFHTLHALNITNGTERGFSPVVIAASVAGTGVDSIGGKVTFNPKQENQRPALTLAGGIVYVCYAGYADTDPYHGWVIGFNATNLVQLTNYVFCTDPNATTAVFGANAAEAGIWMGGGGLAVDSSTNLYFEVGNGSFSATNNSGNVDFGDSFMKLSTTNGLKVADYFTPWDQAAFQANDTDVGSGGLLLLPDQSGTVPHELLGAGKEGEIYLINRDQMTTNNGHFDATNFYDFVVQTNIGMIKPAFDTPACFNGRIYFAGNGDRLKIFSIDQRPALHHGRFNRFAHLQFSGRDAEHLRERHESTASPGPFKCLRLLGAQARWSPTTPRISRPNFTIARTMRAATSSARASNSPCRRSPTERFLSAARIPSPFSACSPGHFHSARQILACRKATPLRPSP